MRIAVLGGGFQGCCIAIALAERGARVALFDRDAALMSRAAVANEGKVHLGYVYAGDNSLATARIMIRGALSFAPLLRRYLGTSLGFVTSTPFVYGVHRDSLRTVDEIGAYMRAVHALIADATPACGSYFEADLRSPPRLRSRAELEAAFDAMIAPAAFDTPEVAIKPEELMEATRARIAAEPAIELRLRRMVREVREEGPRLRVVSAGPEESGAPETFDHVVNALWDGRLALDAERGLRPARQWMHRFKYGIRFRLEQPPRLPSVTLVLGPFGDLVAYHDGSYYLSWYPACMTGHSLELVPPEWAQDPDAATQARVVADSMRAMAEVVPALRGLDRRGVTGLTVKGGAIVAWGKTDIDDPGSELHHRHEIGVTSAGRYHSVDPGKLTMAPYFADICARRIMDG